MKTCYIMVGPSGAGKTTARQSIALHFSIGQYRVFSLDDCRLRFMDASNPGQWWSDNDSAADRYNATFEYAKAHEKEFNQFIALVWAEALKADNIFVDNTNFTKKGRARWIQEARQKGFNIVGVELMVPLQTVIDRQLTRGDKCVPACVVRDMYMSLQGLLLGTEVDSILFVDATKSELTFEAIF